MDPRTYGRIGYLLLAGLLGAFEFVFLVTAISLGVGLAVTLIGIPILIGSVYAWGGMAEGERRIIGSLTGTTIPNPYRPVGAGGRWARLRQRLADPATWKDLTFLLLQFPFGLVSFVVTAVVLGVGRAGADAAALVLGDPGRSRRRGLPRAPALGGTRPRAGRRRGAAARDPRAQRARPPLRELRGGAAGLEPGPGCDRPDDRPARRALAHHRGRRLRAPPHRARPARRGPTTPGCPGADPAHGREARGRRGRAGGRAGAPGGRRGRPGAEGAARPRARHPPGDPHQPRPARGARRPRRPSVRTGRGGRRSGAAPARPGRGGCLLRRLGVPGQHRQARAGDWRERRRHAAGRRAGRDRQRRRGGRRHARRRLGAAGAAGPGRRAGRHARRPELAGGGNPGAGHDPAGGARSSRRPSGTRGSRCSPTLRRRSCRSTGARGCACAPRC